MRSVLVIVIDVSRKDGAQVSLVPGDHMIQAFSAYTADQSLKQRILPRRSISGEDIFNAHSTHSFPEDFPVLLIPIAEEVFWS